MRSRRVVLLVTCLVVAGLCVWLTVTKWDEASKIAAVVSALAAVAAVGVAAWAAWPGSAPGGGAYASRTGKVVARGNSTAVSGVVAPVDKSAAQSKAERTGDADASDGGDAISGIKLE